MKNKKILKKLNLYNYFLLINNYIKNKNKIKKFLNQNQK